MVRGESGRIVLEIDPSQKDILYSALTKNGLTLKDWFLQQAAQYLRDRTQMSQAKVSVVSEEKVHYKVKPDSGTVLPSKIKGKRARSKSK